jgi:hypothetical protein
LGSTQQGDNPLGLYRWVRDEWKVRQLVSLQLRSGRPPEVRAAFDRLLTEGLTPRRARWLIRTVLVGEIRAMMRDRRFFDDERFARRLALLPDRAALDEVLPDVR